VTALALITLSISGFLMWRRRKPEDMLGAPPPPIRTKVRGLTVIILVLAALLPLLAASLMLLWLVERLILPRFPRLCAWLGIIRTVAA